MPKLLIVYGSTRPGRVCLPVGNWFTEKARAHGGFEVEVADLATLNLPLLDEPAHPNRRQYTKDHTKAWSAIVDRADAFVFVTPEYNYGPCPALLNAISFLFHEWSAKPAALVCYGGISHGLRSAMVLKQVLTALKMMALPETVAISFPHKHVQEGVLVPGDAYDDAVKRVMDELARWAPVLANLRG